MKPPQNKKDRDGLAKAIGDKSVELFEKCMQKHGIKVENSTKKEDVYKHIDYWITRKKRVSVDLKSMRRINRLGEIQNKKIWVEFKNVQGKDGWILGSADFICFEQPFHFLFVDRKELLGFCRKKVKNIYVERAAEAEYKLYSRKDREDIISMIDLCDMIANCKSIFMLQK